MNIKLLILDIDGVMTDGRVWFLDNGEECKAFHVHDGQGIQLLAEQGVTIAVISGRTGKCSERRMQELSIKHYYPNTRNKLSVYEKLAKELNISSDETAYVGDDLADIPVMKRVGFPIAVANAVNAVKSVARWQTTMKGGDGAVREACEYLLEKMKATTC